MEIQNLYKSWISTPFLCIKKKAGFSEVINAVFWSFLLYIIKFSQYIEIKAVDINARGLKENRLVVLCYVNILLIYICKNKY